MTVGRELIADESFSRIPPAQLIAGGITGVLRYLTGAGKAISLSEYQSYLAAGLKVGLIMEEGAEAILGGRAMGVAQARVANLAANALGHPGTRPIIYGAEDPHSLPSSQWGLAVAYYQGVASVGGRPATHYGSGALITYLGKLGLIWGGMEVSTWPVSGSQYSVLRQLATPMVGISTFGGAIDHNIVLKPDWGQVPAPTLILPGEEPMNPTDTVRVFVTPDGGRIELHRDGGIYDNNGSDSTQLSHIDFTNAPGEYYTFPDNSHPGVTGYQGFVAKGIEPALVGWPNPPRFFVDWQVISYKGIPVNQGPAGPPGAPGKDGSLGAPGKDGAPGPAYDDSAIKERLTQAGNVLAGS